MNQLLAGMLSKIDRLIVLATIAAVILAILFFRPWVWDATAYHLPFTARQLGVQDYLGISNLLNERYQGFPVLWRYALAPGLILNSPRLYILPNLLAALSIALCLHRLLNISKSMAIATTLCFPISYLGFASPYPDYFTNTFALTGGLLAAQGVFYLTQMKQKSGITQLWCGFTCLAIASNTKIQGLILSVTVLVATIVYAVVLKRLGMRQNQKICSDFNEDYTGNLSLQIFALDKRKILQTGISLVLILLVFYQPLSNLKRYNNPFYPISALGFPGPEKQYSTPLEYMPSIPLASNFLSHYLSALEIDPFILPGILSESKDFSPPRLRSIDMYSGRRQQTGGSIGIIYAGLMALMLVNSSRMIRSRQINSFHESLSIFLPLVSICISFLPQSLELRYYLGGLFVASIGSLMNPIHLKALRMAKILILSGMLISVPHVVIRARQILIPEKFLNVQAELPTTDQCIQLGELVVNNQGRKVLRLNPQTVPNNMPFQCRLVMPGSIYIDYCQQPCEKK